MDIGLTNFILVYLFPFGITLESRSSNLSCPNVVTHATSDSDLLFLPPPPTRQDIHHPGTVAIHWEGEEALDGSCRLLITGLRYTPALQKTQVAAATPVEINATSEP